MVAVAAIAVAGMAVGVGGALVIVGEGWGWPLAMAAVAGSCGVALVWNRRATAVIGGVASPPDRAVGDVASETSRQRMARALVVGRHGLFELDLRDATIVVSEGFAEILGADAGAPAHVSILQQVLDARDYGAFRAVYRLMQLGIARRADGDYRFRDVRGERVWLHCRFDVLEHGPSGRPVRLLIVATDISERKQREVRLQHMALHDPLTGLQNRAAFLERSTLDGATGNALLLVDLDGFKQINDAYGHIVGDAWLVEVARRLQHVVRQGDVVARIGGDEFAVLPAGRLGRRVIEDLSARIVTHLGEPFALEGHMIHGGASVGAAFLAATDERVALRGLYGCADTALYAAKHGAERRFVVRVYPGEAAAVEQRSG